MKTRSRIALGAMLLLGCPDSGERDSGAQTIGITMSAGLTDGVDTSPGSTAGTSAATGATSADGTAEGGEGPYEPPKFDVASTIDAGGGPTGPVIPETCDQADAGESSVGCTFYAVDMDSSSDALPFAVVTANVHENQMANVSVQTRQGGVWTDVAGPVAIAPLALHQFDLPDLHQENTGVRTAGAYRIVGDVPIVAYQFNPIDGASSFLSDASMLFPVPTWDSINHVISTRFQSSSPGAGYPYVTIVAAVDGTNVAFTAANASTGGGAIPAAAAGQTINFMLNDGDVATIVAANQTQSLSGSRIITDMAHPVGVLPGHTCINIPDNVCCCDHLEEQLSGVRQWGTSFVAAHMPVRNPGAPEATFWQIYAAEDGTTVNFDAGPMLTGLPGPSVNLNAGGISEVFVTAPAGIEADFGVTSNKPIAVVGYMTSSQNFGSSIGDPAMAQYVPVEQFLPRYVLLVPGTWINDILVITRPAGATILLDGAPIDDMLFRALGNGSFEVARVPVADGVHVLDGDEATFGVVVVGYDTHDSYAYVGGTGTGIINPNPPG